MAGRARDGVNAKLIAEMRRMVGATNNAQLAQALDVAPPVISKINHGKLPITPGLIVSLHEETGLSTRKIKSILGLA